MTRQMFRVAADGYGVRVDVRVDHAASVTAQELDRALALAVAQAKAAHAEQVAACSP